MHARLSLALAALALAGCAADSASTKPAPAPQTANAGTLKPVNRICPIQHEEVDPSVTITYKGQVVGFCCSECINDWIRLPDSEKDARLKKSM